MDKKPKTPRRQPVTQRAIAEKLGCSQETVSHILSGGPRCGRYSEQTREMVLATARELGYRPHRGAQLMRMGKSGLIGVIHFGLGLEVVQQTARYLPPELKARGYRALVVDLGWAGDSVRSAIDQLIDARVEGVIISQMILRFGKSEVDLLLRAGIPVIAIAGNDKLGIPVVYSEVRSPMTQMTHHLIGLGHRRLLLLVPNYRTARPITERAGGFTTGIRTAKGRLTEVNGSAEAVGQWLASTREGIHGAIIYLDDSTELDQTASAYSFARTLFPSQAVPDAFLCCNDLWARGVFSAALEAGWNVPGRVAITGVDNEAFGSYPPYYLTTIALSRKEECTKAVEMLVEMIEGREPDSQTFVFPAQVVIRRSCGQPAAPAVASLNTT